MNSTRRIVLATLGWTGGISALHARLNVDWTAYQNDRLPESERRLYVAYVPVT